MQLQSSSYRSKLLIFAANPIDERRLRIEEEIRAIQHALQSHDDHSAFQVHVHLATRFTDIQQMLRDYQPEIVHFCGHGGGDEGLLVQTADGLAHPISASALGSVFRLHRNRIRCVVLNACYSELEAQAIAASIDVVVGMSGNVTDVAAVHFADAFYSALGDGWSVGEAFESGILDIKLADLIDCDMPKIIANTCDPHAVWFPTQDAVLHRRVHTVLEVSYYDHAELVREAPRQFFGRQKLLSSVVKDLRRGQRILLTGLGGIGKTCLAAAVAQRLLAGSADKEAAVVWIRCGGEAPGDIMDAIANQLADQGLAVEGSNFPALAPGAKIDRLRRALLDSPVALVVLDDARYLEQMDSLMLAVPPAIPVLTTSRVRFPCEKTCEVMELSGDDAAKMLAFHAGSPALHNDWYSLELCGLLGFHPYAIELAGRLMQTLNIAADVLIQRIKVHPLELSQGNRNVRSLLEDCVGILPSEAQMVFYGFGNLVAAQATSDLLTHYVGQPIAAVRTGLEILVERSLVHKPHSALDYYTMHDLVFRYARLVSQKSVLPTPPDSVQPLLDYLAQHVHDAATLRLDITNILGLAETTTAENLMSIMSSLTIGGFPQAAPPSYFDIYGHGAQFLRLLDQVLAAADTNEDVPAVTRHYLYGKRADAYIDYGLLEEAATALQHALEYAPNTQRTAHILSCLAGVRTEQGQVAEAERLLDVADALAVECQAPVTRAVVYLQRSLVAGEGRKDPAAARGYCIQAIAILRQQPTPTFDLARALLNLGTSNIELGDIEAGMTAYREAESLFSAWNDQIGLGQVYYLIGDAFQINGDTDSARQALRKAEEACRTAGALSKLREIQERMRSLS